MVKDNNHPKGAQTVHLWQATSTHVHGVRLLGYNGDAVMMMRMGRRRRRMMTIVMMIKIMQITITFAMMRMVKDKPHSVKQSTD